MRRGGRRIMSPARFPSIIRLRPEGRQPHPYGDLELGHLILGSRSGSPRSWMSV